MYGFFKVIELYFEMLVWPDPFRLFENSVFPAGIKQSHTRESEGGTTRYYFGSHKCWYSPWEIDMKMFMINERDNLKMIFFVGMCLCIKYGRCSLCSNGHLCWSVWKHDRQQDHWKIEFLSWHWAQKSASIWNGLVFGLKTIFEQTWIHLDLYLHV